MAAYAALVSLMNTLLNIEAHHRFSNSLDKKQVESLRERLDFLLDFVETTSTHSQSDEAQVLERQIASAAFAAEHVIESHIVDRIHAAGSMISLLDLHTLIQDMDSVKEKVIISAKEQTRFIDMQQQQPTHPTSSSTSSTKSSRMVGLDDKLERLLDELTGYQSTLQIIPIAGMGGIGKTTLARNAYEHPLIVQHFDIRAWVTVSQQYTVSHIFSKLLSCEGSGEADEHELGDRLYKSLIGRRYLIILDDIWSFEAWHSIKRFFPDNNNGSRVVVTTRVSSIATQFGPSPFRLGFLDEDKSWELFCENASPGGVCSPELEEIGKKIVKKCKGLPLLIVVIGALLRKSSSVEYWEEISKNIHSISSLGEEESLDILSLSYIHLPAHLKPCFLYMGIFPEDDEIYVSNLIKLWVAEGFVKPSKTQSLEEVAKGYLNDLIDRNLILNGPWVTDSYGRSCSIHDLLRELCLKKAQKESFLCVMRVGDIQLGRDTERCFIFNQGVGSKYPRNDMGSLELAFLARSSADNGDPMAIRFKMLRVVNATHSDYLTDGIHKLVNLRYISISERIFDEQIINSSISLLWNLQTLTILTGGLNDTPRELWEMPQLRHIEIFTIRLPDPWLSDRQDHEFVMQNLQTLQTLRSDASLTEDVFKRFPNIKRLTVFASIESNDFGCLHKLESLKCFPSYNSSINLLQTITFPSSLQELYLSSYCLRCEELSMIGSLPNLRSLQLEHHSFVGSEWNPIVGEFLGLKLLVIRQVEDLIKWNAESSHFPVLEKLLLHHLPNLNEIPSDFGEIPTLAEIYVHNCSESASISAVKILEEQESFGNDGLRVQIGFYSGEELNKFKERIEQFDSSTSDNLQLKRDFDSVIY